jgi:hypothetical protein
MAMKRFLHLLILFLLSLIIPHTSFANAYRGDLIYYMPCVPCDKGGDKMSPSNWQYNWATSSPGKWDWSNSMIKYSYYNPAEKFIAMTYQIQGPARKDVYTRAKIASMLDEIIVANKKKTPLRNKPGEAPYNILPDGYTVDDVYKIFIDSYATTIYNGTEAVPGNVLKAVSSPDGWMGSCIGLHDIEYRGNEVWAFVEQFVSGSGWEQHWPLGFMRIDNKLMVSDGYYIQFYLRAKSIKGEITATQNNVPKRAVKVGEKVDINWKVTKE